MPNLSTFYNFWYKSYFSRFWLFSAKIISFLTVFDVLWPFLKFHTKTYCKLSALPECVYVSSMTKWNIKTKNFGPQEDDPWRIARWRSILKGETWRNRFHFVTFQDEIISSYYDWGQNLTLKCQNSTSLSLNLSNIAWSEPIPITQ